MSTITTNTADKLLTPDEAAEWLRMRKSSLAVWRLHGTGPAFCRIGRRIRYPHAALEKFLAQSAVTPAAECRRQWPE